MFFAVLPSIVLAGVPDYDADKAAAKKTLAVRFGKKGAARLALIFTWLAALIVVVYTVFNVAAPTFSYLILAVIPHALFLTSRIYRYLKNAAPAPRIDSLMVASLTYLIWFALIPLLNLK